MPSRKLPDGSVLVLDSSDEDERAGGPARQPAGPASGRRRARGTEPARKPPPHPARPPLALLLAQSGEGAGTAAPARAPPPPPPPPTAAAQPCHDWTAAAAPSTLADLVVAKPRVASLTDWLARQAAADGGPASPGRLLLVSGPPGCGKATAVRLAAAAAGWAVDEWAAPAPTLWVEHTYARGEGGGGGWPEAAAPYASKLAAFERWVADARVGGGGLPLVSSSSSSAAAPPPPPHPRRRRLLLIRDLPHAAGPPQRAALAACLAALAAPSASAPPAVLITTTSKGAERAGGGRGGGGGGSDAAAGLHGGLHRDLTDAAEAAGAESLTFNPVTTAGVVRALKAAAAAVGVGLDAATATAVAAAVGGDLRTALLAAGLAARGGGRGGAQPSPPPPPAKRARGGAGRRARAGAVAPTAPGPPTGLVTAIAGRDTGLDGLHALGKVLHSKRGEERRGDGGGCGGGASASAAPFHARPRPAPTSVALDAVESLAERAGLDAAGVGAWLFENVPPFFGVSGSGGCGSAPPPPPPPHTALALAQEAAAIADYLSWADVSLHAGRAASGGAPPDALSDAASAAVSLRGVLWARGARPAPPGWLSLRAPLAWTIARASAANRARLADALASSAGLAGAAGGGCGGAAGAATETLPALRSLARARPAAYAAYLPAAWSRVWAGSIHEEVNSVAAAAQAKAAAAAAAGGGGGGGGRGGAVDEEPDDPIEED